MTKTDDGHNFGKNDRNMLVKCYYGNVGRGEQEQEAVDPSWGFVEFRRFGEGREYR